MFGFFEAIYSFLARSVGNRNDASSISGSLHAKSGAIYNAVDNAEYELGVRGDTPRRSGTLHAKVSYLMPINKTPVVESSYTSSLSSGNLISVSGSGIVTGIYLKTGSENANVTISVDGSTLYEGNDLGGSSMGGMSVSSQITFNSSFSIQLSGNSGEAGAVVSLLLN